MGEHTKGPWAYRPRKHDDWGWVRTGYPVDAEGNQPLVACARGGTFEDEGFDEHRRNKTDPFEANARLIAAAPEMLAALKDCVMRLHYDGDLHHDQGNFPRRDASWAAMERAQIAIAKAEGAVTRRERGDA